MGSSFSPYCCLLVLLIYGNLISLHPCCKDLSGDKTWLKYFMFRPSLLIIILTPTGVPFSILVHLTTVSEGSFLFFAKILHTIVGSILVLSISGLCIHVVYCVATAQIHHHIKIWLHIPYRSGGSIKNPNHKFIGAQIHSLECS